MLDAQPAWAAGPAPDHDGAVLTQLTLLRNLADFPFIERCSAEERLSIEERVLSALESVNLLASGDYLRMREQDPVTARVLAERRLITVELLNAKGPTGVFVARDQGLSVMVNGSAHLCLRAITSGAQLQEAWQRLSALDDALGSVLEFAWHNTLGFLTGNVAQVGTGLKAGLLLHLPATVWNNQAGGAVESAAKRRLSLEGVRPGPAAEARAARRPAAEGLQLEQPRDQALFTNFDGAITGPRTAGAGELYYLVNRGTLGESEEEILFHLRQTAGELLTAERAARAELRAMTPNVIDDRVGRAHGLAGGARLLGFAEGLTLWSNLRFGASAGLVDARLDEMTGLLLSSQAGHLQRSTGQALDALGLTLARAELFRGRFGGGPR